jgi:putative transcriptional regulator
MSRSDAMLDAKSVRDFRARLKLTQPAFAQLIGVDLRTVIRWEMGTATPSGPGAAVLTGLQASLKNAAGNADSIVDILVKAAAIGGLAYLLMTLLEDAKTPTKKVAPTKQRRKR